MVSSGALAGGAALLAAAALAPIALGLLARRRALAPGRRADQAYFDWLQVYLWLVIGLWTLWPLALEAAAHPLEHALWRSGFGITAAALSIACTAPLLLATLALAVLGHDVSRRLRGEEVTAREGLTLALLQIGAIAALITGAAAATFLFLSHHLRAGALAGVAGVWLSVSLSARHRRMSALELHAVTAGPLRDRLFGLAAGAGVTLRQLFVVPMARRRIGNAFAVRGGVVILTDVLLARLSRRELDAVMAHEIAHLKMNHPRKLGLAFAVALAPAIVTLAWAHLFEWVGPAVVVALLGRLWIGRRYEYAADAAAVKLCGDPEALISGLSRMSRINGLPNGWSRWREWFITHPSTERRIARIAVAAGIPADRVAAVAADDTVADGYAVPPALAGGGKVFSSTLKRRIVQRLVLVRLAAVVGVPAVLFVLAGDRLERGTLFAAALLTGFLLLLLIHERSAASAIARLERPLRARHADDAAPEFVSLAPGTAHRVYEGFFEWDLGLLTLTPGRLEYQGEETSFVLDPAQVTAIEVARGPRAWIRSARVQITWRDAAGAMRAFNLRPARVARVSRMLPAARALAVRLEAWRNGMGAAGAAVPVTVGAFAGLPPTIESVSGDALARVTSPRAFLQAVPTLVIFSAIATALAGLPVNPLTGPGGLDVFGAALGATLLAHLPYWLPSGARRTQPAEPRPARAA